MNRLLETEQPIPLEFLINGQFLRTSLDDFLTRNGISSETTLHVEYVKALIPPLHVASYEQDDWISSVDILSASSKAAQWSPSPDNSISSERILTGGYDNVLRVWNTSNEVVATGSGHTQSVKAVKFLSPTQIASAGNDRTIRLWKFSDAAVGPGTLEPTLELYGHRAFVDNLAVYAPSSRILSASQDTSIGLWSTEKSESPAAPDILLPSSTAKRRKLSSTSKPLPQRGPLSLLHGHTSPVSAIVFDEKDHTVAYSASEDHSVKTWDLATSTCVDTRTTSQALFSLCHLPEAGFLATGTVGHHITLIDPRASATTISAMTLRGHSQAVLSLDRDPNSSYQLVSGSGDGTCRVWDIRSGRQEVGGGAGRVGDSVYVIGRESAKEKEKEQQARTVAGEGVKVFGVCWDREVGIVSVGEDRRVQVNKS